MGNGINNLTQIIKGTTIERYKERHCERIDFSEDSGNNVNMHSDFHDNFDDDNNHFNHLEFITNEDGDLNDNYYTKDTPRKQKKRLKVNIYDYYDEKETDDYDMFMNSLPTITKLKENADVWKEISNTYTYPDWASQKRTNQRGKQFITNKKKRNNRQCNKNGDDDDDDNITFSDITMLEHIKLTNPPSKMGITLPTTTTFCSKHFPSEAKYYELGKYPENSYIASLIPRKDLCGFYNVGCYTLYRINANVNRTATIDEVSNPDDTCVWWTNKKNLIKVENIYINIQKLIYGICIADPGDCDVVHTATSISILNSNNINGKDSNINGINNGSKRNANGVDNSKSNLVCINPRHLRLAIVKNNTNIPNNNIISGTLNNKTYTIPDPLYQTKKQIIKWKPIHTTLHLKNNKRYLIRENEIT
jgi:hypothetical protein